MTRQSRLFKAGFFPVLLISLSVGAGLLLTEPDSRGATAGRQLPVESVSVPVSVHELMLTVIEESAHAIWDYTDEIMAPTDPEWEGVEYYAIQLSAVGPLLTLGGSGMNDDRWAASPDWVRYARDMRNAATSAKLAARQRNLDRLEAAVPALIASCEGCHERFQPDMETHEPYHEYLRHLERP